MTEHPDTTVIRDAYVRGADMSEYAIHLCDALDAARAERDQARRPLPQESWKALEARAEAAEAHLAQVAGERHRAEARIAAALALCGDSWIVEDIRAALTGDTE